MVEIESQNQSEQTENLSRKLIQILKDVLDFAMVFIRILHELIVWIIIKLLPTDLKDVSQDIVLITGTGHGIGRELAIQYANLGSKVVCVDINENLNKQTVDELNSIRKGCAFHYTCDVSNRNAVLELGNKVRNEVGLITILVNNAGIMPTHRLEQHTEKEVRAIFDINIIAHIWMIQAFFPHFKEADRGHIVSISSLAGLLGLSNIAPYCASKFAVRGLMESFAEELRESQFNGKIFCTTVCPHMTNTGLCKKPKTNLPSLFGLLDPKEVASAVIHAQRSNKVEVTIPGHLHPFITFCRTMPLKCGLVIKDYIDTGVESDLS